MCALLLLLMWRHDEYILRESIVYLGLDLVPSLEFLCNFKNRNYYTLTFLLGWLLKQYLTYNKSVICFFIVGGGIHDMMWLKRVI